MTAPETTPTAAPASEEGSGKELKTFAKTGLVTLAGSILSAAAGFAITLVVARTLGAAEAGVFFIVVAIFMILSEITELGADTGLVRTAARLKALGRISALRKVVVSAMVPVLLLSALTAAAVVALAPWLASLFAEPRYHDVAVLFLYCAAPFLAVSAGRQVALSGTRGLGDLTAYTVINVAMPVARPVLALAVFALGLGSGAVMLAWSVPVGLTFLAAVFVLWRLLRRAEAGAPPDPPAEPGERPVLREFWGFSAARGVAATIEIAIVWLNVLVVGAMVSNHDAGVYATASRFITSGTLVLAATRIAVAPQIAALLATKDYKVAERLNAVATGWVVAASWPLYLALACFGPVVLTLFGEDFTGGDGALAILALAMLIVLAAGNVQTVLLMGGKSSWSLYNKIAALAVNVVLNVLLVPVYGIEGAAVAWAAAYLVDTLAAAVQVRYGLRLRLGLRTFALPALGAVFWFGVVGVVFRITAEPTGGAFAAYLVVACAGFGLTLWRGRRSLHVDELLQAIRKRK
ncbi:lipopolysaccharide biosynthesis protein [Sinosporangium siamense]|uniref:Capsular polysaccharide biosynthesis protein n=1 Tax=Sinosporangium siamense TaxID=1367973 RepID=A0A919V7J3_9ACTN|nr:polysaccharide biosynthesis C-terminal domain-containing protein [Sinosporangium siamense]GII93513.1 capsular polysaccharide biosynthesis protein [Sinosporangium siamense]